MRLHLNVWRAWARDYRTHRHTDTCVIFSTISNSSSQVKIYLVGNLARTIHSIPFHFRLNDGGGRLLSIQEISSFLHRKSTGRSSSDQSVSLPANSQQTNICSNKLQTNIHLHSGIMISAPFPSIFWSSTQHMEPLCVAVAATSRP